MSDDRFQFQPWYIKLWRLRWYLWLPLEFAYCFICLRLHGSGSKDYSVRTIWAICCGGTDIKMNRVWTLEECEERCKEHDEKNRQK